MAMKLGLIMPVCTTHAMQEEAWTTARNFSRPETPFYVLFNGAEPVALPDGVQTLYAGPRFGDEAELWNYCLKFAQNQGWDWFMMIHDDFSMREPGWETEMEKSEGWRVALAGWFAYREWDEQCVGHWPAANHLAVCIDPLSIGFNVNVFTERGYIAKPQFGFGFGAWGVNAWALDEGYAVWHIPLNNWHQWLGDMNSRKILGIGAGGHPEVRAEWGGRVLPSRVLDGEHIEVKGRKIRIAPDDVTDEMITRQVENRSQDCTYTTGDK